MANNTLIGAIRAEATLEGGKFVSGAKKIQQSAKATESQLKRSFGAMGTSVKGFGASLVAGLSVGLLTGAIRSALEYAGSLGEVAQQLGVTTRELQTFRYAVSQNGGTVEQADQALGKFAISISKALSGSKQAAAAFGSVGVSLRDLAAKSKSDILGQIADKMKETGGASANAAAGVAIFGRGFQKIIPTLDQGSAGMNELAAAADELGIVLSDEQIQNADKTADKLDALMTVLKARIAGDVADNSDSIFQFVDALFALVKAAEDARAALVRFQQNYNLPNLLFKGDAFGLGVAGRSATADLSEGGQALAIAKARGLKIAGQGRGAGGNVPRFLGGGGGGGRSRRAPRDTSLRDAFQFEEEQRRADMDILRAKQDLAHDYVERTALSIQMLDLEKEGFEAEQKYLVASKELTQPQADALKLKFEEVDRLRRLAVLEEEEVQRQRDFNSLDEKDYEIKRDKLELEASLAETASERRAIELKILDLAYEEERRRLNRIIQESKDWAEIEAARRDLLALSQKQSLDRQNVEQRTRGPGESYLASLPTDAAKWNEALENVAVDGLKSLEDGLMSVIEGTKSVGEAFRDMIKGILADLIRLNIQKAIIGPIAKALFGGGGMSLGGGIGGGLWSSDGLVNLTSPVGFARGGGFNIKGIQGFDKNTLSLNGIPIANVTYGERISVSNDNDRNTSSQPGRGDIHYHGVRDFDSFRRNETQMRRATRRALGIN